ncbi:MAG: glycosyl hydrolase family 28 protein [Terracidiphilus sp.]|nr:glycosyl hydrolase family 28 protein [Terracidiphilus sp.]
MPSVFPPREFGAQGDGKALDSPSINSAIDACTVAGGGIVYLSPGVYRSGTIVLKSNVTLYLEAGATILGSLELKDYASMAGPAGDGDANQRHLIFARNAENVTLAGTGCIDGQGEKFWKPSTHKPAAPADAWEDVAIFVKKPKARPSPMLEFVNCNWLRIEDLRIVRASGWTLRPINCDHVFICGISIRNPVYGPNTDGVDITCCSNVYMDNCSIDTGDDAICLKSENPYSSEPPVNRNIVITNCILITCCNGFKIGTGSLGGFENITFSNSVIHNPPVGPASRVISGIALEVVDGGWIDGVIVTGIRMQRTRTPIFIRLGNRSRKFDYPQHGLRSVSISNIRASESLLASSITGIPGIPVRDISLSDIAIENVMPGRAEWLGRTVPEQEKEYPEARMFGMLPATGFYLRHVTDLQMSNISLRAAADEIRPSLIMDDVSNARISQLTCSPSTRNTSVVQLNSSRNVWVCNSTAAEGTGTFLKVSGAGSEEIVASGNNLRHAHHAVECTHDVPSGAVHAINNIDNSQ